MSSPAFCPVCHGVPDEDDGELRHFCQLCDYRTERTLEELEEHVHKRHCVDDAPLQTSGEAHFGVLERSDRSRNQFALSDDGGESWAVNRKKKLKS